LPAQAVYSPKFPVDNFRFLIDLRHRPDGTFAAKKWEKMQHRIPVILPPENYELWLARAI
jgi:hypothetical protein